MGICWPSLFNQNHNSGWFLLRGFVDLLRVCSLNIISRNHSNNFLLINKQKTAARLVSSRASLTSWAEGNSLALVGNPSSDGVMIKNTIWGRCFTTSTSLAPHIFLVGWLGQTDSDFIVRWVTNKCFLVALCHLIVRRPILEVATRRLLYQLVKILG